MRAFLVIALLGALLGAAGCDSSIAVRQNGLVPRPRLDTYDGQPMPHSFEVEGHVATAATAPQQGSDSKSGATIARTEYGGVARFPIGNDSDLGFLFDVALPDGGTAAGPSQGIPAPMASSIGWGVALRHSEPVGDRSDPEALRIGIAGTFTAWSIERVEESGNTSSDLSAVAGLAIVPSKRFGNVVVFGSGAVMNQIGVPAAFIVGTGNESSTSTHPTTFNGGGAFVVGGGARVDLGDYASLVVSASAAIEQQGGNVPLVSGAIIFGGKRSAAPPPPPPPPYGPPGSAPGH